MNCTFFGVRRLDADVFPAFVTATFRWPSFWECGGSTPLFQSPPRQRNKPQPHGLSLSASLSIFHFLIVLSPKGAHVVRNSHLTAKLGLPLFLLIQSFKGAFAPHVRG